jgi:hypothetical protein
VITYAMMCVLGRGLVRFINGNPTYVACFANDTCWLLC